MGEVQGGGLLRWQVAENKPLTIYSKLTRILVYTFSSEYGEACHAL